MKTYRIIAWDLKQQSASYAELAELPEFVELPDGEDLNVYCLAKYGFEPAEVKEVGCYGQCLYCENFTDSPHFASDCCGRGMCDDCYDNLQGTDEQMQLDRVSDETLDTIKPEYRDAEYLCFDCDVYIKK